VGAKSEMKNIGSGSRELPVRDVVAQAWSWALKQIMVVG